MLVLMIRAFCVHFLYLLCVIRTSVQKSCALMPPVCVVGCLQVRFVSHAWDPVGKALAILSVPGSDTRHLGVIQEPVSLDLVFTNEICSFHVLLVLLST